jgi:hypothetical protein
MAAGLLSFETQKRLGIFQPQAVQRLWQEHQSGKVNHYKRLWTLTVFTHWYQQHLA